MNEDYFSFEDARNAMVAASLLDYGTPYRWGGNSPTSRGLDASNTPWDKSLTRGIQGGLDCSGAVLRWIRSSGIKCRDYTASTLYRALPGAETVWRGDLCFYGKHMGAVTHVAMALVDNADVVIGANGGSRPKSTEAYGDYCQRMANNDAEVKIELEGYRYRDDFLGFRRPPFAGEIK